MVKQLAYPTYPIGPDTIAPPAPGGRPGRGRDPRAARPDKTTCPTCRQSPAKDDWEHTPEAGQCAYPYDYPFLPMHDACQRSRAHRRRVVPHEPAAKASYDPIAGAPATTGGRKLDQDAD